MPVEFRCSPIRTINGERTAQCASPRDGFTPYDNTQEHLETIAAEMSDYLDEWGISHNVQTDYTYTDDYEDDIVNQNVLDLEPGVVVFIDRPVVEFAWQRSVFLKVTPELEARYYAECE
jgi:hypothetical protein